MARTRKQRRRRGGGGRVVGLLGLGSAAAVAALYAVGRHEEQLRRPAIPAQPPAPPPEPRKIEGPAGELNLLAGGRGSAVPVLLLPGLAGSVGQWRHQLRHLWPTRRAAAVEVRGHGESAPPADSDVSLPALAADALAAADALGWERFVLVGHSLGGAVATVVAAAQPRRVAGLLLADPNGDQSRLPREQVEPYLEAVRADPAGELRGQYLHILGGATAGVAELVMADLELVSPELLAGALEAAASYPLAADLERYDGPRLAVITPLNALPVSLHRLVGDLPTRVFTGTSHWLMLDRPEAFNQLLDAFLASVDG
jgi:pimeloyl-ACP methyl ester carboxylesterase